MRYYFQIGSVESFERKLDDAQRELGIPSASHLSVKLISRQMGAMGGGGRPGAKPGQKGGMGGMGGGQGGFFGMTKANTGTVDKAAKDKILFKDVAGCDEAKIEIMEFGALLVGPPGTGKTLLAKATAGEAEVPFMSISGSDFMEMFVGVGPARVRDLFAQTSLLRVHLGNLKLAKPIEFYSERLAALTPGMAGADVANICNEAALKSICMVDFEHAIDRVIGGAAKTNKVSIVPRGSNVLGFAQYLPNENLLMTKEQLLDRVMATLGGRAAEQVLLGKISTGAVNDLEKVTQIAYSQVAVYGILCSDEDEDTPLGSKILVISLDDIDELLGVRPFNAHAHVIGLDDIDEVLGFCPLSAKAHVIGLDDIDELLGDRPFSTAEMRNIDRVRKGEAADKLAAAAAVMATESAGADATGSGNKAPPPGSDEDAPPPGSGEEAAEAFRRRMPRATVVAT
eukprot:gene3917-13990_t